MNKNSQRKFFILYTDPVYVVHGENAFKNVLLNKEQSVKLKYPSTEVIA